MPSGGSLEIVETDEVEKNRGCKRQAVNPVQNPAVTRKHRSGVFDPEIALKRGDSCVTEESADSDGATLQNAVLQIQWR